jgi:hypothetical protein
VGKNKTEAAKERNTKRSQGKLTVKQRTNLGKQNDVKRTEDTKEESTVHEQRKTNRERKIRKMER